MPRGQDAAWHSLDSEDAMRRAVAQPEGLTGAEAARRLAAHGPNRLPETRTRGPLLRFLAHFHNVLIYVLLGAAIVTAALQHWVIPG